MICAFIVSTNSTYAADNGTGALDNNYSMAMHVEDEKLNDAPTIIEQAIQKAETNKDPLKRCKIVGTPLLLSGKAPRKGFFATLRGDGCIGNSAAPIWIIDLSVTPPAILMTGGGMLVEIDKHGENGLNDLIIWSGNAGSSLEEHWRFDGNQYVLDQTRQ